MEARTDKRAVGIEHSTAVVGDTCWRFSAPRRDNAGKLRSKQLAVHCTSATLQWMPAPERRVPDHATGQYVVWSRWILTSRLRGTLAGLIMSYRATRVFPYTRYLLDTTRLMAVALPLGERSRTRRHLK